MKTFLLCFSFINGFALAAILGSKVFRRQCRKPVPMTGDHIYMLSGALSVERPQEDKPCRKYV